MENISKMEMANALFNKPYIKTEKKFFGFKTNVTYTKTIVKTTLSRVIRESVIFGRMDFFYFDLELTLGMVTDQT